MIVVGRRRTTHCVVSPSPSTPLPIACVSSHCAACKQKIVIDNADPNSRHVALRSIHFPQLSLVDGRTRLTVERRRNLKPSEEISKWEVKRRLVAPARWNGADQSQSDLITLDDDYPPWSGTYSRIRESRDVPTKLHTHATTHLYSPSTCSSRRKKENCNF